MNQILLVADRKTTIDSLRELIDPDHYACLVASNQRAAVRLARRRAPDMVILDNTSGRLCGSRLSTALRRVLDAPLIAIVRDAGEASELEATHYLVKPYTGRQLVDCVGRAMEYPRQLVVGPIRLDLRARTVEAPPQEEPRALTPKLFALLRTLMHQANEPVSRRTLMAEVWNTTFMEDTRTLDVHIRWIREIIEPNPSRPMYLHTVRGVGYYLEVPDPVD